MQRKLEIIILISTVILGLGIVGELIRIERDLYQKYSKPFIEQDNG